MVGEPRRGWFWKVLLGHGRLFRFYTEIHKERAQGLGEKVLAIAMTWGEAGARAEDAAVERGGNTRCPRIYGTQVHGGNKQAKGLTAARLAGRQGWCGRRSSTGDRGQEVDS